MVVILTTCYYCHQRNTVPIPCLRSSSFSIAALSAVKKFRLPSQCKFSIHLKEPACNRIYQNATGSTSMQQDLPECNRIYQHATGSTRMQYKRLTYIAKYIMNIMLFLVYMNIALNINGVENLQAFEEMAIPVPLSGRGCCGPLSMSGLNFCGPLSWSGPGCGETLS